MSERVLIADDHPLTREGLAMAVRLAMPGIAVDSAGSIAEAETRIARYPNYRMLLLDLLLPDARGFSGFLRLQFALPEARIVVITAREDPKLVGIARSLGAAGFLGKREPLDTLARQIRGIAAGEAGFPAVFEDAGAPLRDRIAGLSEAQRRVLFAMGSGESNKRIAAALDITEATVKAHMTAIFRRLGVVNRAQALLALQSLMGDLGDEALA
ncbi:LuxR C-terminal-related transcriptional regulator [Sphingomonas baiyangensis]|uniref:Response regulator transcription factor n=1 Tax=Sphingomonas baiyangensis TaxID=2572576 RepID=A0A4U1L8L5_9SPHN|nr:response regulator transcription factor [Sphingomonas baiyangensis]TKD53322.1 response regulator transcription factor [Sphingomonas baiyangensis]